MRGVVAESAPDFSRAFVKVPRPVLRALLSDDVALRVYLLCLDRAAYQPGRRVAHARVFDVDVGQAVFGRAEVAAIVATSEAKVRAAIGRLQGLGFIAVEASKRGTVITVRGLQLESPTSRQADDQADSQANSQANSQVPAAVRHAVTTEADNANAVQSSDVTRRNRQADSQADSQANRQGNDRQIATNRERRLETLDTGDNSEALSPARAHAIPPVQVPVPHTEPPNEPRDPLRANGAGPVPGESGWHRRNRWWKAMLAAHRRLRDSGIEPNAPDLPPQCAGENERNMTACERSLLDAGFDAATVEAKMLHVIAIAETEAKRDGSLWLYKPAKIWKLENFNRAVDTTLDEAARPRLRRGPSPAGGAIGSATPRNDHGTEVLTGAALAAAFGVVPARRAIGPATPRSDHPVGLEPFGAGLHDGAERAEPKTATHTGGPASSPVGQRTGKGLP